jgi:hypothetical protein
MQTTQEETQAVCLTCNRPVASPWRVWDARGHILNGCVDASHTGHLTPLSESARWHTRPAAVKIRKRHAGW